ncbi:MAG: thiamine phosphate synthase [Sphingomonadales bacterium]|nr:MAG: thiamine phosphate synthase [Sphingomonadales bacterium]TNF02341.1 MAG: thiamine phosphate synthase [Sphingomonadales bacterium]
MGYSKFRPGRHRARHGRLSVGTPSSPPRALPRLWLFTDERVTDDALIAAIARLPRSSGIIFRHYGLDHDRRRRLFERIAGLARRKGLLLLLAGATNGIRQTMVCGRHKAAWMDRAARPCRRGLLSVAAHDAPDLIAARRAGADLAFLSPVFPTRSHPDGRTLGPVRFGLIARQARLPVIALGGMDRARFRRLKALGAYGWGAIDALTLRRGGS